MSDPINKKKAAANDTLEHVLGFLRTPDPAAQASSQVEELDGKLLIELLDKNFDRLDPSNTGISRKTISRAIALPSEFTKDEYVMLQLLGKYFQTIADLSDDEPGDDTVISRADKEVLSQFLLYSKVTLAELHHWQCAEKKAQEDQIPGPPPLST